MTGHQKACPSAIPGAATQSWRNPEPRERTRIKTSADLTRARHEIGRDHRQPDLRCQSRQHPANHARALFLALLVMASTAPASAAIIAEAPNPPPIWLPIPIRIDPTRETRPRVDSPPPVVDRRLFVKIGPKTRIDGTGFRVDGRTFRLAGVKLVERKRICMRPNGARWACGLRAMTSFAAMIRGRLVVCWPARADATTPESGALDAICEIDGRSLAERLVAEGWAEPIDPADPRLNPALQAARDAGRGIWSNGAE